VPKVWGERQPDQDLEAAAMKMHPVHSDHGSAILKVAETAKMSRSLFER